jgi:dihydrofolate reductase
MLKKVSIIFSCMFDGGISYQGNILCENDGIVKKFHEITSECNTRGKMNAVIMGRKTWDSIQAPIADRINIIITTDYSYDDLCYKYGNVVVCSSVIGALIYCNNSAVVNDIFVIGGAGIIDTFLQTKMFFKIIDKVYLTMLFYDDEYIADTFVDIEALFKRFYWLKDARYQKYANMKAFASYVCIPLPNADFELR